MANERNIVILGKVASGKRTLGNHICGAEVFHQEKGVLGARDVGSHYGELTRDNTHFRILTIDTESVKTGYNDPVPLIEEKFERIHSIIVVIANGRYTDESHASLLFTLESLSQKVKPISALVITHCEGLTDAQKNDTTMEFQTNPRGSLVVSFMKKGVHAVGFPDTSALPSSIKSVMQNGVFEDEKKIMKLVENCEYPLTVEDMRGRANTPSFTRPEETNSQIQNYRGQNPQGGLNRLFRFCNIL